MSEKKMAGLILCVNDINVNLTLRIVTVLYVKDQTSWMTDRNGFTPTYCLYNMCSASGKYSPPSDYSTFCCVAMTHRYMRKY